MESPFGTFRRLWWNWFGKSTRLRQIVELLWPEIDTVILNRLDNNQLLATATRQKIASLESLAIETALPATL